jgi:hypothetical protein
MASSFTAALGDAYDQFLLILNGVDPARAFGRLQDAIGFIYFMTRESATATVVMVNITGAANQTIAAGTALVKDAAGNVYTASNAITLNSAGNGTGTFTCQITGPIAVAANSIIINQTVGGVTAVSNPVAGVTGSAVETRQAFETRRQATVEANAVGVLNAIRGSLLNPSVGCTDAYVLDNSSTAPVTTGGVTIPAGQLFICTQGGTNTGIGQAIISKKPPGCGYVTGIVVTITGGGTGANLTPVLTNGALTALTIVSGGTSYTSAPTITISGNGSGATATCTVSGGAINSVTITNGGSGYVASVTFTVPDPNSAYTVAPIYPVTITPAIPVPLYMQVTLTNNSSVPSTALSSIQAAVIAQFLVQTGQQIGQKTYSSSFYACVAALGSWAEIVEITIGTSASPTGFTAAMNIDQIPTLQASNITLVLA